MAVIKNDKIHQFSMVMAVEVFDDLGLIQEKATGMLTMHKVTQIVLRYCQTTHSKALHNPFLKTVNAYSVSVKSLFIFEIFEETLRSIVRSPISTTKPPLISGLTLQSVSLSKELNHHRSLPWV